MAILRKRCFFKGVERIGDLGLWVRGHIDKYMEEWAMRYDQDAELAKFPENDSAKDELIFREIRNKQERAMLKYRV
jgi:hypothetical protein